MTTLSEIKERLEKATPGPWDCHSAKWPEDEDRAEGQKGCFYLVDAAPEMLMSKANADLIAHAPTDLAYLLSLIEEKDKALAFYADPSNVLYMDKYGFLEYGESNAVETQTKVFGYTAQNALKINKENT